jgi:hypothetical protein
MVDRQAQPLRTNHFAPMLPQLCGGRYGHAWTLTPGVARPACGENRQRDLRPTTCKISSDSPADSRFGPNPHSDFVKEISVELTGAKSHGEESGVITP